MAKASRSSKKQPAFDPSELEDLIFSPAVGKGVGSHLVRPLHLATPVTSDTTTVITKDVTTVDMPVTSTVVSSSPIALGDSLDVTTVDMSAEPLPLAASTTVVTSGTPLRQAKLWVTENGDLISQGRVKRIRLAQDVINSAEECVYDTLWNAKLVQAEDSCRIVQAGYDYLVKRTRLSRKTIQRIVAKLLEKDFIVVENRADIYQRTATIYRVFSYKAVLERHARKGRAFVAKMGPGFSYARPLEAEQDTSDLTTVGTSDLPIAIEEMSDMTTVVRETTVTMVKMDRPTVVKMSPHLLDTYVLDNTSSSRVGEALARYGPVDDDVVRQLIVACRAHAPDCTDSEIVHFIHEKGRHVERGQRRIHNPTGFLLTAVPKCFTGEAFQKFREESIKQQERDRTRDPGEEEASARWRREQEAALLDPNVSEQDKHLIRLCLGLNSG